MTPRQLDALLGADLHRVSMQTGLSTEDITTLAESRMPTTQATIDRLSALLKEKQDAQRS